MILPKEVVVYGSLGIAEPIILNAKKLGITVKYSEKSISTPESYIDIIGGPIVKLTDGRTASEVAYDTSREVVLFDLAFNYENVSYLLISKSKNTKDNNLNLAKGLLSSTASQIEIFEDFPGIVVGRIVACLINEGVDVLKRNICSKDDMELAIKLGVSYPVGLLEWLDMVGAKWVYSVLENLSGYIHSSRYRISPGIREAIFNECDK